MKSAHPDFERSKPEHTLSGLNKGLLFLTITLVAVAVYYRLLPDFGEKTKQDEAIAAAEAELENARMINARLAREVTLLRNDGEYLGLFARDKVNPGYMKPGETIFRLTGQARQAQ